MFSALLDIHILSVVLCAAAGSSERSIADANRPERRAVLDRERLRAVAQKQAESLEAAKAAISKNKNK